MATIKQMLDAQRNLLGLRSIMIVSLPVASRTEKERKRADRIWRAIDRLQRRLRCAGFKDNDWTEIND
jgi:hypothetical protein